VHAIPDGKYSTNFKLFFFTAAYELWLGRRYVELVEPNKKVASDRVEAIRMWLAVG